MTYEQRFERLCDDVGLLRVAVGQMQEQVRGLSEAGPDGDRRIARRTRDLERRIDVYAGRIRSLEEWRWRTVGAAAGAGAIATVLVEAAVRILGGGP